MKAWLLDKIGDGIANLRLAEVDDPKPAADEVLLELEFAALNPADRYLAENQYPAKPALPHILGRDGVGVVRAIGSNVSRWKLGDRAILLPGESGMNRPGTLAQKVCVREDSLEAMPDGWTNEQAAAAPLVYLTAFQALSMWGDLPAGVVLITGATGGVGVASVHLAKAMGHTVIGLSRSAEKSQTLRAIGADFTFDPSDAEWKGNLKRQLAPRRVDLAIDNIGGPLFAELLELLGNHGRVSVVGRLAGPTPMFNTSALLMRRLRIGGVAVHAYSIDEAHAAWQALLPLLQKQNVRPIIDSVHPFDQVKEAFAQLARGPMGKVLVRVAG